MMQYAEFYFDSGCDTGQACRHPSERGVKTLKCATKRELKRLSKTKSETFSILCDEEVTYGEVVKSMIGIVALMAIVAVSGYFFGGEVM